VTSMTQPQPITPVLVYEDIQAAHNFLVDAFGFESGGVTAGADGRPVHGEVRAGRAAIWLHRVSPEHGLSAASALATQSGGLAVLVEDVDSHHERARSAGAHIDSEPADQPYGRREYGARDLEGHRWWFGTPIP
jgi:MerR family transcriptional regulator, thiopeptide resistance regulator